MAKMSETQRNAILRAHDERSSIRGTAPTRCVIARNGWAWENPINRGLYPNLAGLRAAGVDIDALHAGALADHAIWGTGRAGYRAALDVLHGEALSAGRYHPRSCPACGARGAACGAHTAPQRI